MSIPLLVRELAMEGKGWAQAPGEFVLQGLQLLVKPHMGWLGCNRFCCVEADKLIAQVVNLHRVPRLVLIAPEGLQGSSIGGPFTDIQCNHLGIKDVGHDLAPDGGLGSASRSTDLGRLDPQLGQP